MLTLSIAFPIFDIPPCSSLCSVANFETVSFTFLDDWFRRCNCKGDTSSSLLAVNTNDTSVRFRVIWSSQSFSCLQRTLHILHVHCLYEKNQYWLSITYITQPYMYRDHAHGHLLLTSVIIKSLEFSQSTAFFTQILLMLPN